tara:strand:+ start:130 stop:465 length:336 start_codon:yes stop_codon:yes gene_type:complete
MENKIIVNITDSALNKAKKLLEDKNDFIGLRVKVLEGGCSGKTYNVDYTKAIQENDEIIEKNGVKFVIDPSAILFLIGSTIDWKEDKFKNGFTFENPNEVARCGCGESFNV